MRARAVFGNPYKDSLLLVAFNQGWQRRLLGETRKRGPGVSDRTWFAWLAGYEGRGWHRSPNGRVMWHRGG